MDAETTSSRARRLRRQNTTLLVIASLVGLWLGTTAPDVSPVAPPGPVAASAGAAAPTAPVVP